ncbi:Deoxynucleotidyltransferase terminal-interacting protein 1 [Halotydeus destructor]|nr:Deoxynucleotidyltransferase terminal-interacting protein 1 [Halotydeus destructor]
MDTSRVPDICIHSPNAGSSPSHEKPRTESSNVLHQRTVNLANFPPMTSGYRTTHRSQSNSLNRAKMGCITSSTKSLNVLRVALQRSLNKEIHEVIQKYLDKFFTPALENIKSTNGPNSVSEHHLQTVCQKILEEAKKMYFVGLISRCHSPSNVPTLATVTSAANNWDSDNELATGLLKVPVRPTKRPKTDSDSDEAVEMAHSDTVKAVGSSKVKRRRKVTPVVSPATARISHHPVKQLADNVRRDGQRWNPSRLVADTKFVLGSKANKALGFGMTRGRLYTKHADLFRYIGDHEDKQWLSEHGLMPPAGGRAYLLIRDDILNLIDTEEYRGMPGVNAESMGDGFIVPEKMILKMKQLMETQRDKRSSVSPFADDTAKPASVGSSTSNTPRPESACEISSLDNMDFSQSQDLSNVTFSPSNLVSLSPMSSLMSPSGPNENYS